MIAKAKVIQIELARTDTIERGLDAVLSQINENGGEVVGFNSFLAPNATFIGVVVYKVPDEEVCK